MSNPIKPTFKSEVFPIALILISFVASLYFYIHFPDRVPTHWNYKGEVDGRSSKGFGAFFFPILNSAIYLLILLLPNIDPRRDRYEQFAKPYHIVKAALLAFMTLIYFYTGFAGLGYKMLSMNTLISVSLGILFIIIGNYLGKVKSNWFMGIRNPWTLSNEEVWNKTNRLGGKLFVLCGFISILCSLLPTIVFWIILGVSVITISLIPVIYSYWLYKN